MNHSGSDIISKSVDILRKYPLCSRCLGRLFAKYGVGLSNITRGNAIKTVALMELHRLVMNDVKNLVELREVLSNVGFMPQLVSKYSGPSPSKHRCYICSDMIEGIILELLERITSELAKFKVKTFVISVRRGSEIERRELDIVSELNLDSWESVRRELKRELGKKVKSLMSIEPDFKHPDVVVLVDLDTLSVKTATTPTYILCRYVKLGRNVPQVRVVPDDGVGQPSLTIEDLVKPIANLFNAEELKLHPIGREDLDIRVLGSGKPMIIELRGVRNKTVGIEEVASNVPHNEFIRISFDKYVGRKHLRVIRSKKFLNIYRLLVLSKSSLSTDAAERLIREFSNRAVRQRTPTRISRRGAVLTKKVYDIKVRMIGENLLEILMRCDKGLRVKELVHGDRGRTSPNMAEALNSELVVLEVDLVDVITN